MNHDDEIDYQEHAAVMVAMREEQEAELESEPDGSYAHHERRQHGESVDAWVTGQLPDMSGTAQYVVMIRALGDPERLPRELMKRDMGAEWRRTLMKRPVGEIAQALRQHLADGEARTMNRAAVEMLDKTADLVGGTPFEDALWSLVAAGEVEFTMQAPVLFRTVRTAAPEAPAAPAEPAAPPPPKPRHSRKPPRPKLSLGRLRVKR